MFEYILLICCFILPVWYRYFFWFSSLEKHKWLNISRDKNNIFHLFVVIEIFLLVMTVWIFVQSAFEFIVFNLVFYYWILSSIFVLWKILRWKLKNKIINKNKYYLYISIIFWIILIKIWGLLYFEQFQFIYSYILGIIIFS